MKKKILLGISAAFLAACSVTDTDEGKSEVLRFEDLPVCSADKGVSGVSYLGTKLYVEDDDEYYLCTKDGWILSDSSSVDGSVGSDYVIDSATVTGSATLGGAFEFNTPVLLKELKYDSKKKALVLTGSTFSDEISSAKGDFVISNVSLSSPYAMLEVTGLYFDMKTGSLSEDSLTLRAIVDLKSNDSVSVNLLSHLEVARVEKLVSLGYAVSAAKIQAEKEILTALGFSGAEDSVHAAMLAAAILFRNTEDEGSFVEAVDAFIASFAENGTWDDGEAKTSYADFAYNLENLNYRDEETHTVNLRTADYRRNLEAFGVTEVPAFETYLTKFWNFGYGLGDCGANRAGVVLLNQNEDSDSASAYFTCETNLWRPATEFERDTVNLGDAVDGELLGGNVRDSILYAFDSSGTGKGTPTRWKEADSIVLVIGKSCTDFEDGDASKAARGTFLTTEDEDDSTNYYACKDRRWMQIDKYTYAIKYLCEEEVENALETVTLDKVDSYWRCAGTKSETGSVWNWKSISEAEYNTFGEECSPSSFTKKSGTNYVCYEKAKDNADGEDKWREAVELEETLKEPCTRYNANEVVKDGSNYYRCTDPYSVGYAWNAADSADYATRDSVCDAAAMTTFTTIGKTAYVCTDSVNVKWRVATEAEILLNQVCSASNVGSSSSDGSDSYVCGCPDYSDYKTVGSEIYYAAITDAATCAEKYLSLNWVKQAP